MGDRRQFASTERKGRGVGVMTLVGKREELKKPRQLRM
jgi:hypothetical protein